MLIESLSCRHVSPVFNGEPTIHNFCIPEKPVEYASNEIEFDDALFRDPVNICREWESQFATLYCGTESTHYDRMYYLSVTDYVNNIQEESISVDGDHIL